MYWAGFAGVAFNAANKKRKQQERVGNAPGHNSNADIVCSGDATVGQNLPTNDIPDQGADARGQVSWVLANCGYS